MVAEFFSLAGYRYDKKKLAEAVAGYPSRLRPTKDRSSPVELTLGIRHDGRPEVLVTNEQANSIANHSNLPRSSKPYARFASDYESLSVILFHSAEELAKKLQALSKKSTAKRVTNDKDGMDRGAFEHGRTLYYILQGKLDPFTYDLPSATWAKSLRIFSLSFNTKWNDTRPSGERLQHPILLDVGWSEATVPGVTTKPSATKYCQIFENRFMNRGSQRMDFEHGEKGELASSEVSKKLKDVFGGRVESTREPIILLVLDESLTRNALRDFGVDTSAWKSGLKELLGHPTSKLKRELCSSGPSQKKHEVKQEHDFHSPYRRRRSRSPSPRRSIKPDPDGPSHHNNSRLHGYSRRPSPPRRNNDRTYAPVYVVELKRLYFKMMRMEDGAGSVVEMAQRFNLREEGDDRWCAGNEAVLLTRIWHSMISGPPIDEHRSALDAGWVQAPNQAPQAQSEDEDDEDRDPNDIVYDETAKPASAERPKRTIYDSDDSDDVSLDSD
ncbi:hypothetical protein AX15_007388 [Amanita polypyramis BW_CC]|nr:hypothetical protein AX15_007388 [Amanita polypyramis BW_CC]